MPTDHRDELAEYQDVPVSSLSFLRDELDWPIEPDDFEEARPFDYTPEELGIDSATPPRSRRSSGCGRSSPTSPGASSSSSSSRSSSRSWLCGGSSAGSSLKKRASANSAERAAWEADDLLFISNYGEGDERQISFAHFSQDRDENDLPTLKVLGWDNLDTPLHLDDVADELDRATLAWPEDETDVEAWRERWRSAFALRHREVITTSKDLAIRLAELARAIRDRIRTVWPSRRRTARSPSS